jgi:hypothetical protein
MNKKLEVKKPVFTKVTDQTEIERLLKRGKYVHPIWMRAPDGSIWVEKLG